MRASLYLSQPLTAGLARESFESRVCFFFVTLHAVASDRTLAIDALPVIMSSISFCFSKTGRPQRFHLGQAFVGHKVGLREEDAGLWRVTFMKYDLGFYDEEKRRFEPFEAPRKIDG
jgi:hypothetical protein